MLMSLRIDNSGRMCVDATDPSEATDSAWADLILNFSLEEIENKKKIHIARTEQEKQLAKVQKSHNNFVD
jgi:hypothetical protein